MAFFSVAMKKLSSRYTEAEKQYEAHQAEIVAKVINNIQKKIFFF